MEPAALAKMTGKSEAYLQARYDLLQFPDYLIEAVQREEINLTAAQWLNKITDENVRREYTRFGKLGGITAVRARAWYESWKIGSLPRDATQYVAPAPEANGER